jgi:protease YdgD
MRHASKPRGRGLKRPFTELFVSAFACLLLAPGDTLAWRTAPQPHPLPVLIHPAAVFGADDRVPLPAKYQDLHEKIGLLFNPRSRMVCTAFCVAPDIVATAGHCLFRIAGERPPRIADFWFARNYDAVRDYARVAGHTTGSTAQHVMSGATALNMRPPIDATKDWAFVRLARAICSKGVLPVRPLPMEEIIAEATAKRAFQVSYHRDFTPWKLAYGRPCGISRTFAGADWKTIAQDFVDADALLLHTCDTGGASSGSPILLETPRGPEVIGINVGTYVQSKVEMMDGQVTRRFKAETVANTAVSAVAFAAKLDAFRHAVILATPAQIRDLQAALRQQQLYAGPMDGVYGATLRTAIEAYEAAHGMPVTGLATEALLKRLGGGAADKAKARAKS